MYKRQPSVVMGKNQSVRAEVNEDYRIEKGIRLARRFSGGGAVYHDKGNINLTFIETTSQPLFEDYLQLSLIHILFLVLAILMACQYPSPVTSSEDMPQKTRDSVNYLVERHYTCLLYTS